MWSSQSPRRSRSAQPFRTPASQYSEPATLPIQCFLRENFNFSRWVHGAGRASVVTRGQYFAMVCTIRMKRHACLLHLLLVNRCCGEVGVAETYIVSAVFWLLLRPATENYSVFRFRIVDPLRRTNPMPLRGGHAISTLGVPQTARSNTSRPPEFDCEELTLANMMRSRSRYGPTKSGSTAPRWLPGHT